MLEKAIVDQLKSVFSKLEKQIELRYAHTDHPKNEELIELLNDVSETSPKILAKECLANLFHTIVATNRKVVEFYLSAWNDSQLLQVFYIH